MKNTRHTFVAAALLLFLSPLHAGFDQGLSAYKAGDFERAFEEFHADAIDGHATAQFNLGVMYYRGEGVQRDFIRAYAWIELATQQRGDEELEEAQGVLSVMLTPDQLAAAGQMAHRLARQHDLRYRPDHVDATRLAGH